MENYLSKNKQKKLGFIAKRKERAAKTERERESSLETLVYHYLHLSF